MPRPHGRARKCKVVASLWLALAVMEPVHGYSSASEPALQQVRIEHLSRAVLAFDIANGSELAAAALSDLRVRVWRLSSGQLVHEFSFTEPKTDQSQKLTDEYEPVSLHFSPDGNTLAIGFVNEIHLYDVATWNEKKDLSVAGEDKLRPDIKATGERPQLKPRTADQAGTQSEQPISDINQTMRKWAAELHKGDGRTRIRDFSFTEDGHFIVASYCRGTCWSSSGAVVAFPSGKDPVRMWDLRSTDVLWEKVYDAEGVISRVAPFPEGDRFIAVNSHLGHCSVGAYDLVSGQPLWSQPFGPCLRPPSIVILPDGRSFITNRIDEASPENAKKHLYRYAAIYSTSTGKKIGDLPQAAGVSVVDVSPDGCWLASIIWRGTEFQIWDLEAGKIVLNELPKGWKRTPDCVLDRVRFSPDNHWFVVGCNVRGDLAVYQWEEGHNPKP